MSDLVSNLFSMDISWPEKIIRTFAVYFALLILLRLAGKRELSQVTTAELIVILLLSNTVQNAIIGDETSLIGGLAGAAILVLINKGLVRFGYHRPRLARLLTGSSVELISNGKPVMAVLDQQAITIEELEAICRENGVDGIGNVQRAVLEATGAISVIPSVTGNDPEIMKRLERIEQLLQSITESGKPATADPRQEPSQP
jgi:uncharacterized membrane protein YcaP (DUF421 family)